VDRGGVDRGGEEREKKGGRGCSTTIGPPKIKTNSRNANMRRHPKRKRHITYSKNKVKILRVLVEQLDNKKLELFSLERSEGKGEVQRLLFGYGGFAHVGEEAK